LETINIPDNLISIDSNAFINCVTLDNIEMTNVRIIRRAAFYGCKSLHTIKLSKYLTSIEEDTFKYCSSLETIIIPPSVRDIGSCAFYKTGLTTITIPESVTRIDHETFSNCYKLVSITFESMIPPVIDSTIFKDTYLEAIYVPSESVEKYKTAKNWGNYASIIQAIKNRTIESTEDKIMKESDNSIYLNQKQGIQKIRNLVQKRLGKNLTDFMEEDGILWWRVKGKETGMWLRVGDTNNSGKTYITYWSDFYNNRQYTSYRYAQRGESKDWIQGYKLIDAFDYNLLRKSEELSQESIEALADEIIKFYEEGLVNGKTISEIIEECNQ
jgi:hypothetical protein